LVPRADEATVLVDLAVREIGAQMPAAPRDGVPLTADVEHRPSSDPPDRSGSKLVNGSNELLWHLSIPPSTMTLTRNRVLLHTCDFAAIDEAPEARSLPCNRLEL
jgi:hypothetical protein